MINDNNNKDIISKICKYVEVANYGVKVSNSCRLAISQKCDTWGQKGYNVDSDTQDGSAYQVDFADMMKTFDYCSVTPSLARMHDVKSCYYQQIVTSLNVDAGRVDVHEYSDWQGTTDVNVVTGVSANTMNITLVAGYVLRDPASHWEANKACLDWAWTTNGMLYDNGECTGSYGVATTDSATMLFDGCLKMYFGYDSDLIQYN